MTHILLLLPHLALGGADKFNLDILGQLAKRGWRATVVTTRPGDHPWRAAFAAVCPDIVDLTEWPAAELPARLVLLAWQHGSRVVLISNAEFGYAALAYLRAHLPGVAIADYCHMEEPTIGGGYPAMSVGATALLDLQVVSSQHLRTWMIERGGDPQQIAICTTNIDATEWNPAHYHRATLRAALNIAPNAPVVLYAGRLARQKQPLLALDVMRAVLQQCPDVVFLIAGDGQFAPYVRGFIRAHRLERSIRMLGAQQNTRVRELLAASDILFLPSQMEGIALAIYEAMAMGVVPVSADVGGQRELVTPEVGVLIERGPHEHADYTTALLQLIEHPDILRERGAAARQRIATRFTLEQMGERMTALLALAHQRHAADPRPVDAAAALTSARAAIAAAEASATEQSTLDSPLRRWLREQYWQVVEHKASWLVPLVETLRRDVR